MQTPKAVFMYDRDCGFCQQSALVLQRLTRGLEIQPARLPDAAEFHAQTEVWLGHEAIGWSLRRHGRIAVLRLAGWVIVTWPSSMLSRRTYRVVARNRAKLSALIGAQACVL